jgi:lipooligosaccharide transport system ATP-binding protein
MADRRNISPAIIWSAVNSHSSLVIRQWSAEAGTGAHADSMPSDTLIRARGLTKRFSGFTAVDAIDFDVRTGEAFGFLGPNGAGKTSTMRMISCASPVTAGELSVIGMDPRTQSSQIKARLGVVPQQDNLDTEISVRENLLMYARYFDISRDTARTRADELLRFVQLFERADSEVESLSGGMKRRLTIARALINEPEVILLDEPTTGLDPQARHAIWERLYQLKRRGATLLLTTHYMDEAEQICDRLVVMDKAKIVAEGSPRELIERYSTREVLELRFSEDVRARLDGKLDGLAERIEELPDRTLLYTVDGEQTLENVRMRQVPVESALVRRSSMEDVFLRLTGRTLVD